MRHIQEIFIRKHELTGCTDCKRTSDKSSKNGMRTSRDEIQWTNNSLKSIRAQVPRNLHTAQSNAEIRCHKHNPNNNQLRISSIFYKVNLFVLTSYDCEEFAHKKNCQTIRNIAHVTEIFVNQSYVLCGERQTASTDA